MDDTKLISIECLDMFIYPDGRIMSCEKEICYGDLVYKTHYDPSKDNLEKLSKLFEKAYEAGKTKRSREIVSLLNIKERF